jgi:hypothetical protein
LKTGPSPDPIFSAYLKLMKASSAITVKEITEQARKTARIANQTSQTEKMREDG